MTNLNSVDEVYSCQIWIINMLYLGLEYFEINLALSLLEIRL